MKLVKLNPYHHPASFANEVDNFVNHFGFEYENSDKVWSPAVDIAESKDNYELKAEIPGIEKDDIKISIEEDMLILSGERKSELKQEGKDYHRVERVYGKFQRNIPIPGNIVLDKVQAKYENGILIVDIPKSEETKPREISVN